jgi:hypothetical protein
VSTIITRIPYITTKEKKPSINYTRSPKRVVDLKSEAMEKNPTQNILIKQISEKFVQLERCFDGESVQVKQFCY